MNISVIIPVYKVELFIERCLNSIINQTYTEGVECIIIDDCTPDRSMEIAKGLIADYKGKINFKLLYHEQNKGLSASRNTGVRTAEGEWLYFLDSDDELMPCCLEKMIGMAEKYHPDFIIGGIKVIGSKVVFPILSDVFISDGEKIATDYFLGKWNTMACNKLIKKEFFIRNKLFFGEGLLHEDMLFSCALAVYASSMCCVKEETYLYKVRKSGSITSELGARNYRDMVKIAAMNAALVKEKLSFPFGMPVFQYFFNYTYPLAQMILGCSCLKYSEKRELYNKLKLILRTFAIERKSCSWRTYWRCSLFFYCPPGVLKLIFHIHRLVKKVRKI